MPSTAELATAIASERAKFKSWYDEHKGADGQLDLDAEGVKKFREWNADLGKRNEELKSAQELEGAILNNEGEIKAATRPQRTLAAHAGQPGDGPAPAVFAKSLGERFVESKEFAASRGLSKGASGPSFVIDLEKEFVSQHKAELESYRDEMANR